MKKPDRLSLVSSRQRGYAIRDYVSVGLLAVGLVMAASAVSSALVSSTGWLAFAQ